MELFNFKYTIFQNKERPLFDGDALTFYLLESYFV